MLQQQFSSFIQTAGVIPPCPGDVVRAAKGLVPLDDFITGDDMEDEDEFDDDDFYKGRPPLQGTMDDHHVLKIPPLPPSLPDPLDPMETQSNTDLSKETIKDSFKVVLLNKETSLNRPFVASDKGKAPMIPQDPEGVVNLSKKDKERIYAPWKFSVIVKAFNKKLAHNYLKIKLTKLWKLTEPLTLIDLGYDYYVDKFNNPEGKFLSVRKWEPNFVPEEATQTHSAIWTRLPQLPTELYDRNILERIGNHFGTQLWIDVCTSATLRGRYARIYIQAPLHEPVKKFVMVGTHKQSMVYEGEGILYTGCGRLGHTSTNCPNVISQPSKPFMTQTPAWPPPAREQLKKRDGKQYNFLKGNK
ncbi:hypothetical protein FXO37_16861 [Capsicum annuum]|nr:hypothetical protein FXO37_16861 [Capsicum annuum]